MNRKGAASLLTGMVHWVAVAFSMSSLLASQSASDERLDIVDRSIELHGGELYRHSLTELQVCSKSGCFQVKARIDGGLFDIEAAGRVRDGQRRVRITNDSVEYWLDGKAMAIDEKRSQSLRDWVMARAYFVFLPFRLNDDSVIRQDLGTEVWNERSLRKVKVSFVTATSSGAEDEFLYWFDPETARLEQFAYSFSGDPGGLRFRRALNYRRVGGLLFFDQENWGADGDGLTVDEIRPEDIADWDLVSTVTIRGIVVQPLERRPAAQR